MQPWFPCLRKDVVEVEKVEGASRSKVLYNLYTGKDLKTFQFEWGVRWISVTFAKQHEDSKFSLFPDDP